MATLELLRARLLAGLHVTVLPTSLRACVMFAAPFTHLSTPLLARLMLAPPLTVRSTLLAALFMPVAPLTHFSAQLLACLVFAAHDTLFLRREQVQWKLMENVTSIGKADIGEHMKEQLHSVGRLKKLEEGGQKGNKGNESCEHNKPNQTSQQLCLTLQG